jgi:hypothetical protein
LREAGWAREEKAYRISTGNPENDDNKYNVEVIATSTTAYSNNNNT